MSEVEVKNEVEVEAPKRQRTSALQKELDETKAALAAAEARVAMLTANLNILAPLVERHTQNMTIKELRDAVSALGGGLQLTLYPLQQAMAPPAVPAQSTTNEDVPAANESVNRAEN